MQQLIQTNDPVLITFVETLLKEKNIDVIILDQNMSVLEGSIGVLQKRVMVTDDDLPLARQILIDANLENWLKSDV